MIAIAHCVRPAEQMCICKQCLDCEAAKIIRANGPDAQALWHIGGIYGTMSSLFIKNKSLTEVRACCKAPVV